MNRLDFYNEMILRENIRKAIRLVRNRRQKTLTEETKLRNIIRNLISEDASETEGPTMNTGGNALDQMLLNTNTLSELEKEYKTLTTSAEQRESFRAHIINAVVKALGIERVSGLPNAAGPSEPGGEEAEAFGALEEAVRALIEAELAVGDTPEEEVEAAAPKLGQEPEDAEDPVEAEREEFASGVEVEDGMDKTGRNYALNAWNKIEKNVTEAYANLGNEEDRKQYYDYLITNLKLYFDQWESELEGSPEEPTTPEYEQEKQAEDEIGGEEEMGMEEPMPEEGGEDELDFGGL